MLYGKQTPKYCLRICRDGLFYVCAWSEGDDAPSTEELVTIDIKNLRMEINGSARSDFNAALEKAGYDYKNGSGSWGWKNNIDFGKDENGNTDYFSEIIKYNSLAVNRTVYKINRINNNPLHGMVCSDVKYAKAGNTVTADIMPDSGWYIKTAEVKTEAGESIPLISESGGSYTFTMPQSNVCIYADFAKSPAAESRYVIWSALPEKCLWGENTTAVPGWIWGNSTVCDIKGIAEAKTDEAIPYYRAVLSGKGFENAVILESGCNTDNSLLADDRVLKAIEEYITAEYDIRINTGKDLSFKPCVQLMPVSKNTQGKFSWEIGAFSSVNKWDGSNDKTKYSVGKWFNVNKKGISISGNDDKLDWQGSLLLWITDWDTVGTQTAPVTVDIRNMRLIVDPADKDVINSRLAEIGVQNGFERLADFDESSPYSLRQIMGDINSDGCIDIRDLVSLKNHIDGVKTGVAYAAADFNFDSDISGCDIAALKSRLLGGLAVVPVQEHPGAAGQDADYEFTVLCDGILNESDYVLTASDKSVTVNNGTFTVPYSVRSSGKPLTVTAYLLKAPDISGTYTFNFQQFAETPSFNEEFDSDASYSAWNTTDLTKGKIQNGKLIFSVKDENSPSYAISTKYKQAYGCFTARIKMPERSTANAAFYMMTESNDYLINPLERYNSWGEIDIVEYFSTWDECYAGTLHWYLWKEGQYQPSGIENLKAQNIKDSWHDYSVVWTENALYFYYDKQLTRIYTGPGVGADCGPMNMILQLKYDKGDGWGGVYDSSAYPYEMCIDRVTTWKLK